MNIQEKDTLLLELFSKLNCGKVTHPPKKLLGGALHQNWKVETDQGTYCVKQLNSQIAKKPDIRQKYEETELIASEFQTKNIPAIAALKIDSHFVQAIDKHLFILYPFIKGNLIPVDQLNLSHAEKIGELFAKIHSCNLTHSLQDPKPHYDKFTNDHWIDLATRYNNQQLIHLIPTLLDWNELYQLDISQLNSETLISHRDLHGSNVLWNEDTPFIIDWESAGYTNPLQEVLGFALEWSGIIDSKFDRRFFLSLTSSYTNYIGHSNTPSKRAFYGWLGNSVLGWTEFNLRRAVESDFDKTEKKRGIEILEKTMIPCLCYIDEHMDEILQAIKIWDHST